MTKYILAGGNDRGISTYAGLLKNELPDNLSELSLLSCFFSLEQKEWPPKSEDWRNWFSKNLGITKYEIANFENFEEKLQKADIVYFHGGNSWLLLESLNKYKDLEQKLKNRVVIGSSAGSNMLSKNFWSCTFKKPGKGLAIIDVNIMVHYGAKEINGVERTNQDWVAEEDEFSRVIQSKEIVHIPEGAFKVFTKT